MSSTRYGSISLSEVSSINADNPSSSQRGNERIWPVALGTFVAVLSSLVSGLMLSFSSPTLAELSGESNPQRRITPEETAGTSFASFSTIGAAFGTFLAWPIAEIFGRKAVLMASGFPSFTGWLLIVYSAYIVDNRTAFIAVLLIGRLLTGAAAGISAGSAAVYIGEIASKRWRGFFGNWNQLFVTVGQFIGFALGTINSAPPHSYHYYHSALIAAAVVVPFMFLMLLPFTAESPRWLYIKGKMGKNGKFEYLNTLNYLRGEKAKAVIKEEITDLKESAETAKIPLKEIIGSFKSFVVAWPFCLSISLMFFQQVSGVNAAVFFSSHIFQQANFDSLSSNLATLGAIGVVQVVFTLLSVFLIERLGRKTLLVLSSSGMILSCALLGVYFYIYEDICQKCLGPECTPAVCQHSNLGWLAIVSIAVFIGAFSIGWGPIPWTMLSELLPDSVRTLAGSISALSNWLMAIVITYTFEPYQAKVTPKFAWWTFAVMMVASVVWVVLLIPETRGLSFNEIQERFKQKKLLAVKCCRGN